MRCTGRRIDGHWQRRQPDTHEGGDQHRQKTETHSDNDDRRLDDGKQRDVDGRRSKKVVRGIGEEPPGVGDGVKDRQNRESSRSLPASVDGRSERARTTAGTSTASRPVPESSPPSRRSAKPRSGRREVDRSRRPHRRTDRWTHRPETAAARLSSARSCAWNARVNASPMPMRTPTRTSRPTSGSRT